MNSRLFPSSLLLVVPQVLADSGANTLDLIQPHSVSAEEVASYYGTVMDQASNLVEYISIYFFHLHWLFASRALRE